MYFIAFKKALCVSAALLLMSIVLLGCPGTGPTALFTASPTSGVAPLSVAFTDLSTPGASPITAWAWDFGDGATSTEQHPSHTYANAGSYGVSITVTTDVGTASESKADYITVNVLPEAAFSASPTIGIAPLEVAFTDASTPGSSPITAWVWDFGDGGSSTEQNPAHTYSEAGTYDISLTVSSAAGSATETRTQYVAVAMLPAAAFSASPTSGLGPRAVVFTDLSTPGSSPITGWAWDFGDGGSSAEQNPSHTYAEPGVYAVALTVTTEVGSITETKPGYITVTALPTPDFRATPARGIAPLTVSFVDLSTPGTSPITGWVWLFGDGESSSEQHPVHTYTHPGTYSVTLVAASEVGSVSVSKADFIVVRELPTAAFSATPTSGTAPLNVTFTDASTPGSSPITGWAWDFGDGGTSAEQDPAHTYTVPGTYSVSLTVTTDVGSNTETKTDFVVINKDVWYVKAGASGGAGNSWDAALGSIQDAVDAASAAGGGKVWVAAGTYTGLEDQVLLMRASVALYGGFVGMESQFEQRDWTANPTIIDGEDTRRCAVGADNAGVDGFALRNGHNTDYGGGLYCYQTCPAVLNCTFSGNSADYGGGLYCLQALPVVRNCVFYGNSAGVGGGLYFGSASPVLTNCSFFGNTAIYNGGGMYCYQASPALTNCTFFENTAAYGSGGGMNCELVSLALTNCTFSENTAHGSGGGMYCSEASPTLTNCTFSGNTTTYGKSGGMYCSEAFTALTNATKSGSYNPVFYGGGLYCEFASPVLTDCTFSGNTANDDGGGLCCHTASPVLTNCNFSGNTANWDGGGMYCESDSSMVTNCSFYGNTAAKGGGLYCYYASPALTNCTFSGNTANWDGGGMFCYCASPALTNCTFSGNTANWDGGGMFCYYVSPTLTNCILWGDTAASLGPEIYADSSSSVTVTYSCLQGGYTGEGNTAADPLFVNAANGELSLRPGSPCIDAGTPDGAPSADIRGVPRPRGAGVDMGAYEFEDSDGDGQSDFWEQTYFGDLSAQPGDDPDGDGLTNLEESLYGADPTRADSDGDGLPDGEEVQRGWNPAVPTVVLRANVGNASGVEDGLSWATAFSSLQAAVNAVKTTGEGEVWVAQGTYTGTADNVVTMVGDVYLYGGFAGTETVREQRDWITHPSIIEGESVRRCVLGANHAALDGFVLQNGYDYLGSGMYCYYTSPAVTNCIFTGNIAINYGGGMYCEFGSPAVTNCTFSKNTAFLGGGLCCGDSSSPMLTNCTFSGNTASNSGGGMYCYDLSSPALTNCILWGDGTAGSGREIYTDSSSSPIVTYSCVQGGYAGEGNTATDPLFVNEANGNLSLRPTSPCIDAGTPDGAPSADIRGVPRPQGAGVDMGAYEFEDLDGDGLSDSWERTYFGDLSAQPGDDPDGDGLTNLEESLYGADPTRADSDSDGLSDGEEVRQGWNPAVPTVFLRANVGNTSGVEDGLSWATAFTSIQAAVDAVKTTGEGEVWVAQGTYTGREGDIVTMAEHVYLYGGFAGTETVREQRDWTARPTIIDGEGTRSLVNGANHAALDGFVLQNGQQGRVGGGLYCYHTSPVVINCSFSGNTAHFGGGLYCNDASPTLTNCSFSGNTAYHGGGIYCYSASPVLTNCTFSGNTADKYGSGIYCYSASPVLTNCSFSSNTATYGGGLYCEDGSPALTSCTFSSNTATYGGGLYCEDGSPALTSCTFSENTASYFGGGLYCHDVSPALTTCIFSGNTTPYRGGGLYCDDASLALTSCSFSENTAFSGGGGLYCYYGSLALMNCSFSGNMASNGGGGLHCYYVSPALTNCSFSGNTSDDAGGGLYCDDASPALANCILWGNTAGNLGGEIYTDPASSPTVTYTCVQGGYTGEGNIAADPLFVDAANGDLRLQAASPCIDTGTADGAPSTDFLGVLRPQGAGYDMGAYEYAGK